MSTWYWYSSINDNWSDITNWWTNPDGTGSHPPVAPWTQDDSTKHDDLIRDPILGQDIPNADVDIGNGFTITGTLNSPAVWFLPGVNIYGGNYTDPGSGMGVNNFGTIWNGVFIETNGGGMVNVGTINGGTFNASYFGGLQNNGDINAGTFNRQINNTSGNIYGGVFNGLVYTNSIIYGGTFNGTIDGFGDIYGGLFTAGAYNLGALGIFIHGGTWTGDNITLQVPATISGGTWTGNNLINQTTITGGIFSGAGFTTVGGNSIIGGTFIGPGTYWYWYDQGSGYWSDASNWWICPDGTGIHPSSMPWQSNDATKNQNLSLANDAFNSPFIFDVGITIGSNNSSWSITGICDIPYIGISLSTIYDGIFTGYGFFGNGGNIYGGTFSGNGFTNSSTNIYNGTFSGNSYNNIGGAVYGGTFNGTGFINGGIVYGGTFNGDSATNASGIIVGGMFTGANFNNQNYSYIYGSPTFSGSGFSNNGNIGGGIFSGSGFTTAGFDPFGAFSVTGGSFIGPGTYWHWYDQGSTNWSDVINWFICPDGTGVNIPAAPWVSDNVSKNQNLTLASNAFDSPIIDNDIGSGFSISGICDIPNVVNHGLNSVYGGTWNGDNFINGLPGTGYGHIYGGTFNCPSVFSNIGWIHYAHVNTPTLYVGDNIGTYNYTNGYIVDGVFTGSVVICDNGEIDGGTFNVSVVQLQLNYPNYITSYINGGTFNCDVNTENGAHITNGVFYGTVNSGYYGGPYVWIDDGIFYGIVYTAYALNAGIYHGPVYMSQSYSAVHGGIFLGGFEVDQGQQIDGGTFNCDVQDNWGVLITDIYNLHPVFNGSVYTSYSTQIVGGTFNGYVQNSGYIYGGTFNGYVLNVNEIYNGVFMGGITFDALGNTFGGVVNATFGGLSVSHSTSKNNIVLTVRSITFFAPLVQMDVVLQGIQ